MKSPPPAPPRSRAGLTALEIKRISTSIAMAPGADAEEKEDDQRSLLFNRLTAYYQKWEPVRVNQGIGHIVDWVLANGEDALNERLRLKYSEDLADFEERLAEEDAAAEAANPGHKSMQPAESFMGAFGRNDSFTSAGGFSAGVGGGAGGTGSGNRFSSGSIQSNLSAQGPTIRDRLLAFYTQYDSSRLEKGVDDLVDYVSRKGLPALNQKLMQKYNVTLEDFERGVTRPPPAPVQAKPKHSRISMRTLLRRSFRAKRDAPPGQLPEWVRPLLEIFYMKYDATKLSSGSAEAVVKWTAKHGVAALDTQLSAKYLESLTEFGERMARLREDLVEFYKMHDPSKLAQPEGSPGSVDSILRWGIRNGRAALNRQLQKKYGADLVNKTARIEEEPDF